MGLFAYRGRNSRGDLVRGELEGSDAGAVADQLASTGIIPVDIRQTAAAARPLGAAPFGKLLAPRVGLVDLMLFSRQMHTLLKSGVPILRAMAGLEESTTNPTLVATIRDLRVSLDSGRELSAAMQRHPKVFGDLYVSLVRIGEQTGLLEDVFLRLYDYLEFERDMRERVKNALRYPTIVIATMAAAVILINVIVVPVFAKVFEGLNAPLPLATRILLGFSNFMVHAWPLMIVAAVAAYFGFRAWVSTPSGRLAWDRYKLRIPIAGKILLKATLARFARSFALSSKAGVPVVQGLTVVARAVDNEHIGGRIAQMRDGVERGESLLRSAVASGVFTSVALQMIAVGEESGELDDLMTEVAQMYEREVDYELKSLASQIEPILIVFLGGLVLLLALAVFLPLWNLGTLTLRK